MSTTKPDNLRIQIDAAARAHIMATERRDSTEAEKQFKRLQRLLRKAARAK